MSKAKIIKWTREEYKEVMTAFHQALKEPKDNTPTNLLMLEEIYGKIIN